MKEILNIKSDVRLVLSEILEWFKGKANHVTSNRFYD